MEKEKTQQKQSHDLKKNKISTEKEFQWVERNKREYMELEKKLITEEQELSENLEKIRKNLKIFDEEKEERKNKELENEIEPLKKALLRLQAADEKCEKSINDPIKLTFVKGDAKIRNQYNIQVRKELHNRLKIARKGFEDSREDYHEFIPVYQQMKKRFIELGLLYGKIKEDMNNPRLLEEGKYVEKDPSAYLKNRLEIFVKSTNRFLNIFYSYFTSRYSYLGKYKSALSAVCKLEAAKINKELTLPEIDKAGLGEEGSITLADYTTKIIKIVSLLKPEFKHITSIARVSDLIKNYIDEGNKFDKKMTPQEEFENLITSYLFNHARLKEDIEKKLNDTEANSDIKEKLKEQAGYYSQLSSNCEYMLDSLNKYRLLLKEYEKISELLMDASRELTRATYVAQGLNQAQLGSKQERLHTKVQNPEKAEEYSENSVSHEAEDEGSDVDSIEEQTH